MWGRHRGERDLSRHDPGPRIERVIEAQADRLGVSFEEAKRRVFTDDAALGVLTEAGDVAGMRK